MRAVEGSFASAKRASSGISVHPTHLIEGHALAARRAISPQRQIIHAVEIERVVVEMREQRQKSLAATEIDQQRVAPGAGMPTAAVAAVRNNSHHAGRRFDPVRRLHLDRQAVFVTGPVDPDLIADHERCQ